VNFKFIEMMMHLKNEAIYVHMLIFFFIGSKIAKPA